MSTREVVVAALYVEEGPRGAYVGLDGVDPWGESQDARKYTGPHPVVAHPPCARWGRFADGGPSHKGRFVPGDDGGCFIHALCAVRRYGGVLEHPKDTVAFRRFCLTAPPVGGGWVPAGDGFGWVCCVAQGHYGHRASKMTWLYWSRGLNSLTDLPGLPPPDLLWGPTSSRLPPQTEASLARRGRGAYTERNAIERMCRRERLATPVPFRDLLINLAKLART